MASKNMMKSTITIFLTINLVFFGSSVAQAPAPQASGCPRDLFQFQACVNAIPAGRFLNGRTEFQASCCILVAGLSPIVASVCLCNAIKASTLEMQVDANTRLTQLLGFCGVITPTPSCFRCT